MNNRDSKRRNLDLALNGSSDNSAIGSVFIKANKTVGNATYFNSLFKITETAYFTNFYSYFFYVFSTVHHSIGLFLQPTLMHNSITTCMSHYHPRHVSGLDMPILRRNNCTNTASGILALISGCTLHRLRADSVVIELCIKVG